MLSFLKRTFKKISSHTDAWRLWACFCVLLYPFFSFISQNATEFAADTYLRYGMTLALSAIVLCIILFIIRKKDSLFLSVLTLALFLFWSVILHHFYGDFHLWTKFGFIALFFLFFISLKKAAVVVSVLLSLFSLFSLAQYASHGFAPPSLPFSVCEKKLTHTPNIYLLVLESYAGQKHLRRFNNFDNTDFYDFLTQNGFQIYSDFYANATSTRASLSVLFYWTILKKKTRF